MRLVFVHLVFVSAIAAAVGCAEKEERFTRAVPVLRPCDCPEWTGARPGDEIVARVNGIPVPAHRYARALSKSKADPKDVLNALIVEEALAQRVVSEPDFKPKDFRSVFERLLVRRWLERTFVEGMRPETITEKDLEPLWKVPTVRAKYDRLTYFVVQDYQWICCDGSPAQCESVEARRCFSEGESAMLATKAAVELFRPESEDLPLLVGDLKALAPRLAYQEYEFAYDERKKIQKGRRIFDDAVVNAVVSTPVGQFAKQPVRSRYGWHLVFVKEVHPEVHKDLSDPDVRLELAKTFINYLRQRRFVEVLADLIPAEVFLHRAKQYEGFRRSRPPRFDVTIYKEVLEAWKSEKSETEGL